MMAKARAWPLCELHGEGAKQPKSVKSRMGKMLIGQTAEFPIGDAWRVRIAARDLKEFDGKSFTYRKHLLHGVIAVKRIR